MSSTLRVRRHGGYTAIPHTVLRDHSLSLRARGLLGLLLSHDVILSFDARWISTQASEGREAILTALGELRQAGYLHQRRDRQPNGRLVTESVLSDQPCTPDEAFSDWQADPAETDIPRKPGSGQPGSGKPAPAEPPPENPTVNRSPIPEELTAVATSPTVASQPTVTSQPRDSESMPVDDPPPRRPSRNATSPPVAVRPDVEQICTALADAMVAAGFLRPTIDARWRTQARLMLDRDGRTVEEALGAIRWAFADDFWCSNIRSTGKLRAQFDQMRIQGTRRAGSRGRSDKLAPILRGVANRPSDGQSAFGQIAIGGSA